MSIYEFATSLTNRNKQIIFMLFDGLLVPVALFISVVLSGSLPESTQGVVSLAMIGAILTASAMAVSHGLGLTRIKLNAYELQGIMRTATFSGILALAGYLLNIGYGWPVKGEAFLIFAMAMIILGVSGRLLMRQILIRIYRSGSRQVRVLIYGAGQTGQQLAAALRTDRTVKPVAFVDDNPRLQSLVVSGLPVYSAAKIQELIIKNSVDRVVLAMPSSSQPVQSRIAHRLRLSGCEVHSLPSFASLISTGEIGSRVSPVSLTDLLGRNNLERELPTVSDSYTGRRILITGAGGSIGSELCRQLIACKPEALVLLDHSELALYTIAKEFEALAVGIRIIPVLGSVNDRATVEECLRQNEVEVVLHAAAYKHVGLVEMNELAGLENNVFGTKVLAEASRDYGVDRFILVSSDKAVRPTNVMGASKRLAELIVQDLSTRSEKTRFSMVRFGNVLGSSGSVIPLFEEQIARGGPVTLTHGEVTRYFMTISEAARLVLLAGSFARGGDLFVLDMGDPVPIKKLARQMIEGSGLTVMDKKHPDGDIEIVEIGLRPGEKLHEELLISQDMLTTPHQKIMRAKEGYLSEIEMANALRDLRKAIGSRDAAAARAVVARWVEQYDADLNGNAKIS
ncbi:polysaccharide biosynthesis protein [Rhodalgimonas zhirmunskyi]|uniref:Polysaccharide biosynthesis protein n=1 Tax=Rhodalgimonas zhirmunskyi TaxID=2964767 RepID=A0AAJ1U5M3_9RHOB|nr:nucleoside-diphosphate sugar epimerase/dehydratase [Rhodoalgimonas zhirmunskyi]MDQ2094051.1 polysaccharide biosynthesis protein [Rhodoalgimonas zhirmunskyi]